MKKAFKKMLAVLVAVLMVVANMAMITVSAASGSAPCPGQNADHNKDNCTNYAKVEEEPVVAPGCCTYGYTLYECLDCGEYFASDIEAPTEEDDCDWEEDVAYVAPTCTEAGTWAKYTCSVGGAEKYTDGEGVTVDPNSAEAREAIAPLDHDFGDFSDCHEGLVCQREGCDYTEDAGKHTWEKKEDNTTNEKDIADSVIVIDKPSTIYEDGEFHYECGVCGAESPVYVIHAHEHDYVANNGTPNSCTATGVKAHYTCSVDGCELLFELVGNDYVVRTAAQLVTEKAPHTFVEEGEANYDDYNTFIDNTCKTSGYTKRMCTVCEEWITESTTEADPDKHTWHEITPAVTGDCENVGKTAVKYCEVCRIVVGGEDVPGTGDGHAEVTVTVAATCTKKGYTLKHCTNSFCSVAVTAAVVVDTRGTVAENVRVLDIDIVDEDADAHTLGWVVTEEATCVAPGHKIWACTECKAAGTATGAYAPIPVDTVNGHDYQQKSPATCTEAEVLECTLCEGTKAGVPALGHTSKLLSDSTTESPILTVYPTCNENGTGIDGYTYQECQRCGTEINKETVEYNTTYIYDNEEDARSQHELDQGAKTLYKAGSCTEQGLWTLGECANCNRTVLLTMVGTGKGHKQPTTGVVNPTCTEKGYYSCQNDWCTNVTVTVGGTDVEKYVEIPALEHDLDDVDAKDPTCTEAGWYAHEKCTRDDCGATFIDGQAADPSRAALGHENNADLTNTADCDEFGYRIEYCTQCATHDMYDYVAILGHDMPEESAFTSCVTDKVFVCGRGCGYSVDDEGSAPGHKNSDGDFFWPGCLDTEDNRHCVVCCDDADCADPDCDGLISNDHDLYVEIDNAAPTCTQPGYDLVSCRICDYEQIIINVDPLDHKHDDGSSAWVKDGECTGKSVAPSFTAGGSYHYCCALCDACMDVPQDILTGVAFDMTIENAVVEDTEIVDSSIIAVNVSMKSLKIDIWGFQFSVGYDANNLKLLGYTYNNADFNIKEVNDNDDENDPTFRFVTVLGYIENTPEGEKQNVTVENSTDIITLYFQVNVDYDNDDALAELLIGNIDVRNADEEPVDAIGDYAAAEIGVFSDANGDLWVTVADVQYAYYIATGLYEDNTYDACVDINKDGWITAADVRLLADFATGAADYEDLFAADDWTRPEGFVPAA